MLTCSYNPKQHLETSSSHYQHISQDPYSYLYNLEDALPELSNSPTSPPSQTTFMPVQSPQNPPIRVHQSSPFSLEDRGAQQQMLAQGAFLGNTWGSNDHLLSPSSIAQNNTRRSNDRFHKRASSTSSLASAGPPSPQDHNTVYPIIAGSETSGFSPLPFGDSFDLFATPRSQGQMQKSLPTPAETPTSHNFTSDYPQYSPHDAHSQPIAMRRIQTDHRAQLDDDAYAYSAPPSVSSASHHDSPATPHTAYDGEYEDASKNLHTGQTPSSDTTEWMNDYLLFDETGFNSQITSVPHGMPEVQYDESWYQNVAPMPQQQQQILAAARTNGNLSPFRTSLANRFQAAQLDHVNARTSSSVGSVQREKSPFRQDSHYNSMTSMGNQRLAAPQMTAAQFQQHQQNMNNAAMAMAQQQQQQQQQQQVPQPQPEKQKTVSPKEILLEYHESTDDAQTPLFPPSQDQASNFSLPRRESSSNFSGAFGQPNQYYMSATPTSSQQSQTQQYPFIGQQRRQQSSMRSTADSTSLPDFPAHLASMETTASSGDESSTPARPHNVPIVRPSNTSTDSGTYSCTYHGCTQRFESPAKLQKHKREAHRHTSPSKSISTPSTTVQTATSSPTASSHTASAQAIALRNSQAGPHKCERINPTTGKPCNSIFSRPYDLTRHEDTIHNGRKQKVRCHLCTEEKTFSRNDALTRHMRVVHPDVDWPGKGKRKGGRD